MSQHMDALAKANEHRFARAEMKREVKAGELRISEVLREHPVPDWLASMLLEDLLRITPNFPSKLGRRWLLQMPVRDTATVADLTYRKRRKLSEQVAEWEIKREQNRSAKRATPHAFGATRTTRRAGAA